jgi:hypothetical protein
MFKKLFWRELLLQPHLDAWETLLNSFEGILQDNGVPLTRNTELWGALQEWRAEKMLNQQQQEKEQEQEQEMQSLTPGGGTGDREESSDTEYGGKARTSKQRNKNARTSKKKGKQQDKRGDLNDGEDGEGIMDPASGKGSGHWDVQILGADSGGKRDDPPSSDPDAGDLGLAWGGVGRDDSGGEDVPIEPVIHQPSNNPSGSGQRADPPHSPNEETLDPAQTHAMAQGASQRQGIDPEPHGGGTNQEASLLQSPSHPSHENSPPLPPIPSDTTSRKRRRSHEGLPDESSRSDSEHTSQRRRVVSVISLNHGHH